jgi:NADH-quinone oxidoreductase subunit M
VLFAWPIQACRARPDCRRVPRNPVELPASFWYAFLAGTTLILGAAYTLWLVKRVIFGAVANDHVAALKDVTPREFIVLGLLAAGVLALGLWPAPLLDVMRPTLEQLVQQMMASKL